MFRRFFLVALLVFSFSLPAPAYALGGLSFFGGQIGAITPCPLNPTSFLIILKGIKPTKLVYQTGASFSYREGPPVRVGQWLLGLSSPFANPTCGGTGLILFHGSSK